MIFELLKYILYGAIIIYLLSIFRPSRKLRKKPRLALLPKYRVQAKATCKHNRNEALKRYGFKLKGGSGNTTLYAKEPGHSSFLNRIKTSHLTITPLANEKIEIHLSSGIFVLFDSGQHFRQLKDITEAVSDRE